MPRMLDEGVRRIDEAYAAALRQGGLLADPTLIAEPAPVAETGAEGAVEETALPDGAAAPVATGAPTSPVQSFTLQVDTPNDAAATQAEGALRRLPGMQGVVTTSLALGGISVMQLSFAGDQAQLRAAAFGAGLQLTQEGGVLRLRRAAP